MVNIVERLLWLNCHECARTSSEFADAAATHHDLRIGDCIFVRVTAKLVPEATRAFCSWDGPDLRTIRDTQRIPAEVEQPNAYGEDS